MRKFCIRFLAVVVAATMFCSLQLFSGATASAQSTPFYQGKTIRIIVGFTSGGLYDQYVRILERQMPEHIPGSPNILVQKMSGGGTLTDNNYAYDDETT